MSSSLMSSSLSVSVERVVCVSGVRGVGTSSDPSRVVTQYWSMSGHLLAEHDGIVETPDLLGHLYVQQINEIRGLRRLVADMCKQRDAHFSVSDVTPPAEYTPSKLISHVSVPDAGHLGLTLACFGDPRTVNLAFDVAEARSIALALLEAAAAYDVGLAREVSATNDERSA